MVVGLIDNPGKIVATGSYELEAGRYLMDTLWD